MVARPDAEIQVTGREFFERDAEAFGFFLGSHVGDWERYLGKTEFAGAFKPTRPQKSPKKPSSNRVASPT